jgi:hypothetical protein
MLLLLKERIYNLCISNAFRWNDITTKFHENWFRHISNITVITATISEAVMLVLPIERTCPV